jgi:hypothetical protein
VKFNELSGKNIPSTRSTTQNIMEELLHLSSTTQNRTMHPSSCCHLFMRAVTGDLQIDL